jgi:hypothetical protein
MGAVQVCKCNCNKKAQNEEVHIDVDEPLIHNNINNTDTVSKHKNAVKLYDSEFNGDLTPPESSRRSHEYKNNSVDILMEIKDDNKYYIIT